MRCAARHATLGARAASPFDTRKPFACKAFSANTERVERLAWLLQYAYRLQRFAFHRLRQRFVSTTKSAPQSQHHKASAFAANI
jgi:hypothetical protein